MIKDTKKMSKSNKRIKNQKQLIKTEATKYDRNMAGTWSAVVRGFFCGQYCTHTSLLRLSQQETICWRLGWNVRVATLGSGSSHNAGAVQRGCGAACPSISILASHRALPQGLPPTAFFFCAT